MRSAKNEIGQQSMRVMIFNAAPDTGNLGVSALGYSVIAGLSRRIPGLSITVADYGVGIRTGSISVDGKPFKFHRCGVRLSKNILRQESLWNIEFSWRFGAGLSPIARHLKSQNFVLDITGGDSFTDLYGSRRFESVTRVKALFLDRGIPLGLLPQTYGPFNTAKCRKISEEVIRRARFAWARDERSFKVLKEMLGPEFDADRHHCGVDVAFLLESVKPADSETRSVANSWIADTTRPLVGFNVSGLIYNDPRAAVEQYNFVADYREVVTRTIRRFLETTDANVLLIPHVIASPEMVESDESACNAILKELESVSKGRLSVLPALKDPREVKWVISQCAWFCGTRMHATIAGLSTGVPTAAVAYSLKTAGVFETCGQLEHVADPRELSTDAMVEQLWKSWTTRDEARSRLAAELPGVLSIANRQMDQIAAACIGSSYNESSVSP